LLIWAMIAVFLVAGDQVIKLLVENNIGLYDTIEVVKGALQIVYVQNRGAAFSVLENMTGLLALVSVLFCAWVVYYFVRRRPESKLLCTALTLMFSGAAGNAVDRIVRGYVVDYIKLSFLSFPVFNLADVAITAGAVLLVIYILFFDKKK
jgi:signal peptidase II